MSGEPGAERPPARHPPDRPDLRGSAEILGRSTSLRPRILVVLGSGLHALAEDLTESVSIPLDRLPGMAAPDVEGHEGRLVAGRMAGVPVWIQAGRLHLYEGHSPGSVAAPVRVTMALGVEVVILTNAAGGIRRDLDAGSLVLLDDVLNLSFRAPLDRNEGRAPGDRRRGEGGGRTSVPGRGRAEMGSGAVRRRGREAFDPSLQELAMEVARSRGTRLLRGTYAGVLGPSFETAAEIRMIRRLGGDVVGMSTVPEALAARGSGVGVLGLSLVTNRAAGLRHGTLSHEEVIRTARRRAPVLAGLVRELVRALGGC